MVIENIVYCLKEYAPRRRSFLFPPGKILGVKKQCLLVGRKRPLTTAGMNDVSGKQESAISNWLS